MRARFLIATSLAAWLAAVPVPAFAADTDGDGVPDAVEPVEGLNPNWKDNDLFGSPRLFAMQQYRDFLGREGEAGGISFYHDAIFSGSMSRTQVVEAFLGSPEFQNGLPQCTRLYFSFFNRIPDYGGLMFQVDAFRAGVPLESISQNFSNSPEFTTRYGSLTNTQYINLVYQNVLGRAPDAGGFDFYFERLEDGRLTRGQMMIGFSESPEFQELVANEVYVTAVYVGMLRRAPDAGGMQFYVDQIESGSPRSGIIIGFMGSPEYRDRFLPPANLMATQKLLGGTWTFEYTVGTPFQNTYEFTSVDPPNAQGNYVAIGTDATGGAVAGGYFFNGSSQWAVLDPSAAIDLFYTFTFSDNNNVSGCYYEISPPGSENLSACYPMTGFRSPPQSGGMETKSATPGRAAGAYSPDGFIEPGAVEAYKSLRKRFEGASSQRQR